MKKITILGLLICSITLVGCSQNKKADDTKNSTVQTKSTTKKETGKDTEDSKTETSYSVVKKLGLKKYNSESEKKNEKKISDDNANALMEAGYIEIVDTYGMSKDEVTALFEGKGIKVKFVNKVKNDRAEDMPKDTCFTAKGGLNLSNYMYGFTSKQWAKSGSTIIVPYAAENLAAAN